ncbi:MAG: BREX system serine/threonine kinase PglW [Alphaproteobacteria bacterium]|nr:BREX system serine/threonine kinase PglW [Alphaproteobacteria bacterium]
MLASDPELFGTKRLEISMVMISRWQEIAPSQFPWEREALDFVREQLPDHEPYHAWSNFEFIADDGTINEVDLLVVTPNGFFMVEIKSRPGRLDGDNSTWKWTDEQGRIRTGDNPLLLTSRKARKLISLLRRQKAFSKVACPYLDELVFLSSEKIDCHLAGPACNRICLRDDPEQEKQGIISALVKRDCPGLKQDVRTIDKPIARAIGRAIEQMGIRPSQRSRKVADLVLDELIFQCPKDTYQEWVASHVSMKDAQRRIRIYNVALQESEQNRSIIHQAAEREFRLLEQLDHEGILRADQFTQHERGPALIFRYDPEAVRLDHFLIQRGETLSIDIRLSLVRQVAEALRFAHAKGIVHRTLSPQSILVYDPDSERPRIKILNWQLGRQYIAATSSSSVRHTFSIHPEQLVEDASLLYMAPESITDPESVEPYADVFSLGAIAYHIFGGQPPASSAKELAQKLQEQRGLDIAAISDGAGEQLCELIKFSTNPHVSSRLDTIDDFLELLEAVEDELTAPTEEFIENPLEARAGDVIEGGFKVKKRLGSGGSSTAFLVDQGGKEQVLKVANKPDYTERLESEYRTLKKLRHPLIVEAYDLVRIGDLRGITTQYAGTETLAQRLRKDGRMQVEFLERFGNDLLEVLKLLEEHGIYHRDIKPDNIGIGSTSAKGKLRLLLFDFSLSCTPLDNVRAGTVKYMDPFLQMPVARKYDLYAERFSAAMTLYEMAAGMLPKWGDGKSDPAMLDCEATIEAEMFEPGLRSGMQEFFAKALKRNYKQRYDNADEMLKAWRALFEHAEKAPTVTAHDEDFDQDAAIQSADLKTQLVTLGLSTRAMNAMDRLNVVTAEDLLRVPIFKFYRLRGVGRKTRDEITHLARSLHRRFPEIPVDDRAGEEAVGGIEEKTPAGSVAPESLSVDALFRDVVSTGGREKSASKPMLMAFLGVGDTEGEPEWANQSELGRHFKVTRARIGQIVTKARENWRRMPSITHLRDDIHRILDEYGGIMSVPDMASAILASRGSTSEEPSRTKRAKAAVRAAIEAERGNQDLRFSDHRSGDHILVSQEPELVRYAEKLGTLADEIARQDPLLAPGRAIEKLREVPAPEGAPMIATDNELVRLAVYMSDTAAVSSRLEIYPRGMAAVRALRLAAGALAGSMELSVATIRARIKGRYPESETLPDRPALDELLSEVGLELEWKPSADGGRGAYRFRHIEQYTVSSGTYGSGFTSMEGEPSVAVSDAEERLFEQKLKSAAREGAFLVLSVDPRRLAKAEEVLAKRFDLDRWNLDRLFLPELRARASEKKVKWDVVLRADQAERDSQDWSRLNMLFGLCIPPIEAKLSENEKTALITYPGLLARYDQMGMLERLRDKIGTSESKLHGLWVLVTEDGHGSLPTLNGKPIPVISGGQHARIPVSWLKHADESQ